MSISGDPMISAKLATSVLAPLIAAVLASMLAAAGARAEPRDDFLAGRTKACAGCDLTGANFKRRDLTGADLTGAKLKDANFHDAKSSASSPGSTSRQAAAQRLAVLFTKSKWPVRPS